MEAQEEIWNMGNSELEEVSAEPLDLSGKKNRKGFTFPLGILHVRFQHFYVMMRLMYLCYMLFVYAHILLENTQENHSSYFWVNETQAAFASAAFGYILSCFVMENWGNGTRRTDRVKFVEGGAEAIR